MGVRHVASGLTWTVHSVAGLICVAAGLLSEQVAFGLAYPGRWIPDLIVGLTLLGAGLWVLRDAAGRVGWLLVVASAAWFAGNINPAALFWHRAPLIHAIVGYTGLRSPVAVAGVVAAYLAAVVPVWQSDIGTIVAACVLVVVVAIDRRPSGARPSSARPQGIALTAAVVLAASLIGGAVARLTGATAATAVPNLWVYECVLCGIAISLAAGSAVRQTIVVADLVVELGESPSGALRDALARAAGDPSLQVGYWQAATGDYTDLAGSRLSLAARANRTVHMVDAADRPFAVIVHDSALTKEPALAQAIESAARLVSANGALHVEVRDAVAEVVASRRRLVRAADVERQRLERRVHHGPEQRLIRLQEALAPSEDAASIQLEAAIRDLRALARGLRPRELDRGLPVALPALIAASPISVGLSVVEGRYADDIETTVYYACAEALANAVKHAGAQSVSIEVLCRDTTLVVLVRDDGVGGAQVDDGRGLAGLRDRFDALGGRLTVEPNGPHGTRLTGVIPCVPDGRDGP